MMLKQSTSRAERRSEPRMMCSELVRVHWVDRSGKKHHWLANLEDISVSGACLQLRDPVPRGTPLRIVCSGKVFRGQVVYSNRCVEGCLTGVQFAPDSKWPAKGWAPKHFLDARSLSAPDG